MFCMASAHWFHTKHFASLASSAENDPPYLLKEMPATLAPLTAQEHRRLRPILRAGYARLSIEEARTDGASIQRQLASLKAYDPEMRVFVDDGESGTKVSRPEFDRLLAYIKEEKVEELVVPRVDRLGRNHQLKELIPLLYHSHNCRVVCTEEQSPDLSTSEGHMLFDLRVNLACTESDRTGRRMQAAIEKRYRDAVYKRSATGYILIDGQLYPDDQPRHCPLPLRHEARGIPDEWGIASDAFPGLSNFEITGIPLKIALRYGSWTAGFKFSQDKIPLTRCGSWDPVKQTYKEAHHSEQLQEIIFFNGAPTIALRPKQVPHPTHESAIFSRCQNPLFYGHYYGRRNWDADARASVSKRTIKHSRLIDSDTYEFFIKDHHVALLSEEDYGAVVRMNDNIRKAPLTGKGRSKHKAPSQGLDPDALNVWNLHKSLNRYCYCVDCGKPLSSRYSTGRVITKHYYYLYCYNRECQSSYALIKLEDILSGLTLRLADYSRKLVAGEVEPLKLRPAESAEIKDLLETREAIALGAAKNPGNRVLRNELKRIDARIEALEKGAGTGSQPMASLKAHQRFLHPKAQEAGAWLELLLGGQQLAHEILSMLSRIEVKITRHTPKGRVNRIGAKRSSTAAVTSITLLDEL